ncbi:hyalin-like isoform X5 [Apostichopus japonicus]|uniref:hyalin-like isoform X5 n=1 Tax=Stichopus japonicus TaxID=307972 RepID=UPI003AB5D3D4
MTQEFGYVIIYVTLLGFTRGQDSIPLSQDGDHVCTRTESFNDRRTVSSMAQYELTYYTSCGLLSTCSRKRTAYRAAYSYEFFLNYREVLVCCDGYTQTSDSCTPCSSETWGSDCANQCLCENEATCDPVNGECYCPPGYTGALCDSPCPTGKYGQDCSSTCECPNSCQPVDGTCICEPGFTGQGCTDVCPTGTFGQDCAGDCPICTNGGSCDTVTGLCICQQGFGGVNCNIVVAQLACNCTNGGTCDGNGDCLCPEGFGGQWCELEATVLVIHNCPDHITVVNFLNISDVSVSWEEPTASSPNGPVMLVTSTHVSGETFPRNSQDTVTYVFEDPAGLAEKCEFVVKITEDTTAPVISDCPHNLTVTREKGLDPNTVTWSEPSATDDSGNSTVYSSHIPGDVFPPGPTMVNYIFTDGAGNSASCIFIVTVAEVDTTPPVLLSCPSNITVTVDVGQESVAVSWQPPTAEDLGGQVFQSDMLNPNDTFMIGVTEVVYEFADAANNRVSCTFTITVVESDSSPPIIMNCPDDIQEDIEIGTLTIIVTWKEPTAVDNSGQDALVTRNSFPGMPFAAGTREVVYIFSDSDNNEATCSFNVTVIPVDTTPPHIENCPGTQFANMEVGTSNVVVTWPEPTVTDNSGSFNLIGPSHSPGDTFPTGLTNVVYNYEDNSGNSAVCEFRVNVSSEDTRPPSITGCPLTQTVNVEAGTDEVQVIWTEPTASDTSGLVSLLSNNYNSGDLFSVGDTIVEYVFVDAHGNQAVCSFIVRVTAVDTRDPLVINCPQTVTEVVELGVSVAIVRWDEPFAVDLSGSPVFVTKSHQPPVVLSVGDHVISYSFEDLAGNVADCVFTVSISTVDTVPPTISDCPDDISDTTELGTMSKAIVWNEATATDASGFVTEHHTHFSGESFFLGLTEVVSTFTDPSGNYAVCTFLVNLTAVDTTPPRFQNCPTTIFQQVELGVTSVIVTWNDVIPIDVSPTEVVFQNHNSGDNFPVGKTQVGIVVADSAGQQGTCTFFVEVVAVDTTPPEISNCFENGIIETVEIGESSGNVFWVEPTATDLSEITISRSHAPGTEFSLGITMVTYIFFDNFENVALCMFSVTVLQVDTQPPEIMGCPDDIVENVEIGTTDMVEVSWTEPTASDPSGVTLTFQSLSPPASFAVGTETVVMYSFVDNSGIRNECVFVVEIKAVDTLSPIIADCPEDMNYNLEVGRNMLPVYWEEPTATDNGPETPILTRRSDEPGNLFSPGSTIVHYQFSDYSNNLADCNFSIIITVVDTQPPMVVLCSDNIVTSPIELGAAGAEVSWQPPLAFDFSGLAVTQIGPTHQPGAIFQPGATRVEYRFVDAAGLEAICDFLVIVDVVDTTPPTVHNCPQSITEIIQLGVPSVPVFWEEPSATDLSQNVTVVSRTYLPGDVFYVGRVMVLYVFSDNSGNQAECSFHVTINTVDVTPPVVAGCPSDVVVTVPFLSTSGIANWVEPTAEDLSGTVTLSSQNAMPGDSFDVGVTSVTYVFSDAANNRADCTFLVTVQTDDPDRIVISNCPRDIEVNSEPGETVNVFWGEPFATNQAGTAFLDYQSHSPPTRLPPGKTVIMYSFKDDAGAVAICQFAVQVVEVRELKCPAVNITAEVPSDSYAVAVNWTTSSITNNTGSIQITSEARSGDLFPVGLTEVHYTFFHTDGRSIDCILRLFVFDVTPPEVFNCPTDISIGLPAEAQNLAVMWEEPIAVDNSGSITEVKSFEPGNVFRRGSHTVAYEFSDPSGNIGFCTFRITLTGEARVENDTLDKDFIITVAASSGVILLAIIIVAVCLGSVCCCRSHSKNHSIEDDIDIDDNYFNDGYAMRTHSQYVNNGYHKRESQVDLKYDEPPSTANSIKKRGSIDKSLQRRDSHYSQTLPRRPTQDPLDEGTRTIKRAYNGPVPGISTTLPRPKSHPQLEVEEMHQDVESSFGQEFPPIPEHLDNGDYLEIRLPLEKL